MDEYRGRYPANTRHGAHQMEHPPPEPCAEAEAPRALIPGFGLGFDWLEDYWLIILVAVVAAGLYLWLGRQEGGIGSLLGGLGGFLK